MRGAALIACTVAAACYAPEPKTGSPCVDDAHCPSPLVCAPSTMTCEHDRSGSVDSGGLQKDASQPTTDGACTSCAANDTADGAIDVTAGGTFTGDALGANDDVAANGCGADGGRDLFYKLTLSAPQVYYFDTFGSAIDTVVRVYAKPCAQVGSGANATACADDQCGDVQSQVALSLPAGESCIVVDQADAVQGGAFTLHVVAGGRDGLPLPLGSQTLTGDTCGSTNVTDPLQANCDAPGSGGKDHAFFFTTCPGQSLLLDANLCPQPSFDPVLYVKRVNGDQLGCNDDSCGLGPALKDVAITSSTLYFLYVDGYDLASCGVYSLDTNLR